MKVRLLKRALSLGIAVVAVSVLAVLYFADASWRQYGAGRGLDGPVDALLVLGGGIDPDGVPGYSSRRRVVTAVALLRQGRATALIFSGGPPWKPPELSSGALMRDYAVSLGAPAGALLVEPRAVSTFENLRFGFALAEEHGLHRLALVTDSFHVERARRLAAYFGRPEVGLVAAPGLSLESAVIQVWSILREALAWWYNLAKVGAWELMDLAGIGVETRQGLVR